MEEQKTQQFARFYLKGIKNKLQKDHNNKTLIDELNFLSIR